jgi:hypothetical protein
MHTLPGLRNNYVPESPAQVEFCASHNSVYTRSGTKRLPKICNKTSGLDPSYRKETKPHLWTWVRECFRAFPFCTLQPDRSQHDRVITQQYSSTSFISLQFHSRKENEEARLKNVIISFLLFFFKCHNSETADAVGEGVFLSYFPA